MLLKALFALFSYFIYSAFIIKISNLSVLFNPLVHVFYAVFARPHISYHLLSKIPPNFDGCYFLML